MAVVRLVLRYKDDIRLFNFGQIIDRTGQDPMSYCEPFCIYHRRSDRHPWVNEDTERAISR